MQKHKGGWNLAIPIKIILEKIDKLICSYLKIKQEDTTPLKIGLVGNKVVIGNNVKIQNNVSVYDNVIIENDVFCGPSMVFTNVYNPRSAVERKSEYRDTLVQKGATLGANCTIVCGNTIGAYSFVGAGSVVTRDVPDNVFVAGNPARVIKEIDNEV